MTIVDMEAPPGIEGAMDATASKLADDLFEQIQSRMKSQGMTRAALAERMDVTPGYVSHLFKGRKRNLTLESLVKLANALGMEVEVTLL